MVSGESETFVSRVRRVGERRAETKPLDVVSGGCTVRRLVPRRRCGGGGRRGPRRYLARGAESDAQRARHRGHGACVSLDALRAMAPRPTRLGAGPASANVKFQTSLFHVSKSLLTCRNRQRFCAAPIGRGDSANFYSRTNPIDAAVIAPVIDVIRVKNSAGGLLADDDSRLFLQSRCAVSPHPGCPACCPPRFNLHGRTA